MKIVPLSLLALLTTVTAFAKPPADLQQRLDEFAKDAPGGVAIAWVDADGTAFFTAGKMSAMDPRAITPDTQFEIASITKVFTALLLVESERLGQVSRLDPAAKYLLPAGDPDQAALSGITLLSLATHTSGLPRLPKNFSTADAPEPYAAYDLAKLVTALRTDGPKADTDGVAAYSNFGFAVLGQALAAAWDTSYADALATHVLTPLGLKATSLGLTGLPPPPDLAPGHLGGRIVPNWTQQAFAPAGALRSSARDMARFLAACLGQGDHPLQSAFAATLQPQHVYEEMGGHVGLAWMLTDDAANPIAWQNGATAGSHSFLAFNRKTGAGVVILSNNQQASEALGFGLLGTKFPEPTVSPVKNVLDYRGYYPLSSSFALTVTDRAGVLYLQATGQAPLPARLISPDKFAVVGVPAEITFARNGSGTVIALVLHQNGTDHRGGRQELPALPTEVILPAATLREYAGQYPLAPGFILTVTEEGGQLFVQATNQSKFPVYASAKDEFFYKIVQAQLSFQRDATGKVTGLILHQNGQDTPAIKLTE
jgi:CubicO group peptidase (beta-lactamase class C family)